MGPPDLASTVNDGFGFRSQLDFQPSRVFAIGVGAERVRFYNPENFHFLVGTLDFSTKLILPPFLGGVGYLQTGVGLNLLGQKETTWGGKTCARVILGKRIPLVPGFGLDLACGYHMMGKPEAFRYADVRLGVNIGIDRDRDRGASGKSAKPAATPKPKATETKTIVAIPAKKNPGTIRTRTATATPDVIDLKDEAPTRTPTASPTRTPEVVAVSEEDTVAPTASPTRAVVLTQADKTMREIYEAGIAAYKGGRYQTAVRLLKKALLVEDATQFWYYAEANAMLGAIYHYKIKVPNSRSLARSYYQAALKIDPQTRTALKGMRLLKATAPKPKPKPAPVSDDVSDEALGIQSSTTP